MGTILFNHRAATDAGARTSPATAAAAGAARRSRARRRVMSSTAQVRGKTRSSAELADPADRLLDWVALAEVDVIDDGTVAEAD
jgi:hypothetical protein